MISSLLSRIVILVLGTLYPAYASYKAVKTKNVKDYVKWMMYWIVFALFTCAETFADIFVSWIPFYYELKIAFVLWLLSPATKGSSILYRKFVHPHFAKREQEIDSYISQASDQGYYALVTLGSRGLNYAANVVAKGPAAIVEQIKSYSLSDLTSTEGQVIKQKKRNEVQETELDDELDNRLTEERFRCEMEEMDSTSGEGGSSRTSTAPLIKRLMSTRSSKSKDGGDLYPLDEIEETASDPEGSHSSKKISTYNEGHCSTMPRLRSRKASTKRS